jgi:aryl sulfotransferase
MHEWLTNRKTERMIVSDIKWPHKTREVQNHHFNSLAWNDFMFREDDIVIATYAKSGTTWLQQIVGQLLFNGAELNVWEISPWLDLRMPPTEVKLAALEAQRHRRFIKTHLPVDALVYSPRAKYIYIARDGRDVAWSLHNHHLNANDLWYQIINDTPGRVGPAIDRPMESVRDYFLEWLERDGYPLWSFWEHVRSWWTIRDLPNLMLLHYADMKADLPRVIRKVAAFLDIEIDEASWPFILEHCQFDYMKKNSANIVPMGGTIWDGGAKTFIHKGTNGRWRDTLTEDDCLRYEAVARAELGDACANWLANGRQTQKLPAAL